ncbi:MAG: vitamin B12-dependent ribonucleotide reductase, partial [Actinomycetota bacterium]
FNIGIDGVPQQASACFILSVDDDLDSILEWYREEAKIFKGGSGAGVNLSRIRASVEPLSGGGTASGPISFMRGADASAGAVKSGGTTRRAAKMVILDVAHPDIEEFVGLKAHEERKIRALRDAGFDMSLDGVDASSVQFQNANNSVRVTDAFMQAVLDDEEWQLRAVGSGEIVRTVRARELWQRINQAAWECADPGLQFDTTINRWHTAPNAGRITASNPCSEYFHLDDSACNLASLNLLAFLDDRGVFDVEGFAHAVAVMITAQDILVGAADYPTPTITENSHAYRQLGLGYANLGALLMALGLPYDSDAGRAWAASVSSLMSGAAYATSARIAARVGAFAGFEANREPMLDVLDRHRTAAASIADAHVVQPDLVDAGRRAWAAATNDAVVAGVRNSQVTVLAPTGTIGFAMDCDTTGIEPDLGLVKTKHLVGGGTMTIVNRSILRALRSLGYDADQVDDIVAHVDEHHSVIGAPHLASSHLPVFACSMGDNTIHYEGHVRMMAAVQPLLSGGISKTVNMPEHVSVDDVAALHLLAWQLGLKSVAIYRDNCKVGQPLSTAPRGVAAAEEAAGAVVGRVIDEAVQRPVRQKLPRGRRSRTFEFQVADCKGFVTIGEFDDGRPGEIFLTVSKQGSTMAGIMDAFAKAVSYGLQYGVPLRAFVKAFTNMKFEPAGMTDDPDIRFAGSIMDYLFRRLALEYMEYDERAELGVFSVDERRQPTLPGVDEAVTSTRPTDTVAAPPRHRVPRPATDAPMCMPCGATMVRAGSCHVCPSCGSTSGCS